MIRCAAQTKSKGPHTRDSHECPITLPGDVLSIHALISRGDVRNTLIKIRVYRRNCTVLIPDTNWTDKIR
ncbi:hypothetical protein J2129_002442 [Methanofollis sp. W23]|nr:hypothetical protein [Methanofollis sp. W23]